MMSDQVFNKTPQSERVHIALFGRRNAGKSSLINALTGQQVALVSDVPGTTTDPVSKAMEILPIGPCVIIDTAGFDDVGKVGKLRIERTRQVIKQADIAIVVVAETGNLDMEISWTRMLKQANVPYLSVLNKVDLMSEAPSPTLLNGIASAYGAVRGHANVPNGALGLELLHIVAVRPLKAALELFQVVDVVHHAQLDVVGVKAGQQVVEGHLALLHVARAHILAILPGGSNVALHNPVTRILGARISQPGTHLRVAHPAVDDVDAQLCCTNRNVVRLLCAHAVEPLAAEANL